MLRRRLGRRRGGRRDARDVGAHAPADCIWLLARHLRRASSRLAHPGVFGRPGRGPGPACVLPGRRGARRGRPGAGDGGPRGRWSRVAERARQGGAGIVAMGARAACSSSGRGGAVPGGRRGRGCGAPARLRGARRARRDGPAAWAALACKSLWAERSIAWRSRNPNGPSWSAGAAGGRRRRRGGDSTPATASARSTWWSRGRCWR